MRFVGAGSFCVTFLLPKIGLDSKFLFAQCPKRNKHPLTGYGTHTVPVWSPRWAMICRLTCVREGGAFAVRSNPGKYFLYGIDIGELVLLCQIRNNIRQGGYACTPWPGNHCRQRPSTHDSGKGCVNDRAVLPILVHGKPSIPSNAVVLYHRPNT